ncbi:MAG: hypothetical protein RR189_01315 [Bacilli bacterium]
METKNTFGVVLLTIIILTISIGGYFFMRHVLDTENKSKTEDVRDNTSKKDFRINKDKDFIYYESPTSAIILDTEEIIHQDVVINFLSMAGTNDVLKNELNTIKSKVKYMKDVTIPEGTEVTKNSKDIYSLEYRTYEDFAFGSYVSLLIKDFTYDVIKGETPALLNSYVIDKTTGNLVESDELLKKYNLTMDEVKKQVKKRLSDMQVVSGDVEVIDIEGTLKNFTTFAFYINKNGKLAITYVVKSPKSNYNDSIELN